LYHKEKEWASLPESRGSQIKRNREKNGYVHSFNASVMKSLESADFCTKQAIFEREIEIEKIICYVNKVKLRNLGICFE
jgi:hypothetical protein